MRVNFDHYKNLEKPDFYLCNPDGTELYSLPAVNRFVTLRFNDLSELSFDVYSTYTTSDGKTERLEAYDYVVGKRLVYATNIGWFQITGVPEVCMGPKGIYKSVSAESLQTVFKTKGVYTDERIYCFYNPQDPYDSRYDSNRLGDMPSILGQMYSQLGIKQDLSQGKDDPEEAYDDWTVTYINPKLIFANGEGECRTLKEGTKFGYEWMVKDIEDAFKVVFIFDFLYKTIKIMYVDEIATDSGLVFSFSNFMNRIDVTEDVSELVTVLNCTGNNCDISPVNPMGTNYICDFSYYMDPTKEWMSADLIAKLTSWKATVDANKAAYKALVQRLQAKYLEKTKNDTELTNASLALSDLKNARDKKLEAGMSSDTTSLTGVVLAETVDVGETSDASDSAFHSTAFARTSTITAYKDRPSYVLGGTWSFSGASMTGTAESCFQGEYCFFADGASRKSYCKLTGVATVNTEAVSADYHCGGFERYIDYAYVNDWINIKEGVVEGINSSGGTTTGDIAEIEDALASIANTCNILKYFSDSPKLLKELYHYWVEGDYENTNFAILENTTAADGFEIASQLMEAGEIELAKASQPHYSFSLSAIDFTKQYEFREQIRQLELGKVITVEKEDGVWYYPALLEMKFNIDIAEDPDMKFANAMRLDDWGYTYADLVSSSAAVSRQVSANWQQITDYSKNKETIGSLIRNPLDATLRAATANMYNQDFTVDSTGILGRKKKATSDNSSVFENEQLRIMNNLILFTDDNWSTAKAALGKIRYTNDKGQEVSSYGLIADTIIGSLLVGERLLIKNQDSTVSIGGDGIIIKDSSGNVLFKASPTGLTVRNYATSDDLEDAETTLRTEFSVTTEGIESRVSTVEGDMTEVKQTATEIESRVSTVEGDYADIVQRVDDNESNIGLIVKNGAADAGLIIKAINDGTSEVVINADKLNLSGLVTVSGLKDGTTVINGDCIETGTILGSKIKSATITATQIAGGTITADEIKAGTITAEEMDVEDVSAAVVNAQEAYIRNLAAKQIEATSISVDHIGTFNGGVFLGTQNSSNWFQCRNGSNGVDVNDEMFDVIFGSNEIGLGTGYGLIAGAWEIRKTDGTTVTDDLATFLGELESRVYALERG